MTKKALYSLTDEVSKLPGVGPAVKEKLNKRDIHFIGDFLFLLPYKFQDRTQITPISNLTYGETAQVLVTIISASVKYARKRMLVIETTDNSDRLFIRLFHFGKAQMQALTPGTQLLVYGQATTTNQRWAMMHPEYKIIKPNDTITLSQSLTPVYPSTLGIGSNRLMQWVDIALGCLKNENIQDLEPSLLNKYHLANLKNALFAIHRPPVGQKIDTLLSPDNPNLARIVLDELLAKQIGMLIKKQHSKIDQAFALTIQPQLQTALLSQLPFQLTAAQNRVITEIFQDLEQAHPMHRLVQGDVGSGKTLVAIASVLQAIANDLQAVIMAPTEVLSEQHYLQAKRLLEPLNINVVWLSSKATAKQRKAILPDIASGKAQLIIGTHALFQTSVAYHRLGLVVIDEQHRFGVHQRLLLKDKAENTGKTPHILVMTATPIPRTLAMSAYADLDTSVIDELPPGRQPIETLLLPDSKRDTLIQRIKHIIAQGQQVYWVCPLIEESDSLQAQAAEQIFQQLSDALPSITIGLLHGRLKSDQKTQIISDFQAKNIDLLVATTVIEVGVDVPNATLMVIESAERFGLAQLHQLRGRVGRGALKSYCMLLYKPPLSDTAKQRLQVIRNEHDGFAIAKADLSIRGAGEILGTRQTGEMQFRIVDLERDEHWIEICYDLAQEILATEPDLAESLVRRWVGECQHYAEI